ncbi:MAG: 2-isopropylmalate synthase [Acidimicrobiales bacterium]
MQEKIIIFDTTLRDGEQSPGISLDAAEKLEIAEQLARLNVDYIEAGFPVASQGDFEAVAAIARSVQGPTIAALSRTHLSDVDRCWEALRDADKARIHVFISTSPSHMEHMLKMSPSQVLAETKAGVSRAREHTADVEFSPQDATRTPFDFMLEVLQCAVDAGATTLNIPDTVGYGIPWEFGDLIANISKEIHGEYIISTHCHNDLGLATANSLAGVRNGARQVEVCINGLGERAGNAALEEVVMALTIRSDIFANATTQIKTEELARTSRLVSRLTGYPVQYNKSVVGRNAFAHESGIHQHGVLSNRSTYEIIAAESVGQTASQIVLGKHSGRHAFSDTVAKMGLTIQGDALNAAFQRFKDLADRKVEITEADIEAIVTEEVGVHEDSFFQLDNLAVSGSSTDLATATVTVTSQHQSVTTTATGNGMLDAAAQALSEATKLEARLTSLSITALTGGVDAVGTAVVQLESSTGLKVSGRAISTDVVEAAAKAYLDGLNRLVRMRTRLEQRDVSITP